MNRKAIIFATLLALTNVYASEIDPFNNRSVPLKDSLPSVNLKANTLLQDALKELNEKNHKCSEKKLYKKMRKVFRNQYTSKFGKWIVKTDELDKMTTYTSESIYKEFKWYQAVIPGLWAKINDPAGQIINVGGVYVGTDKFEHFSGSGFLYFKKFYLKGKTLEDAMNIGYRAETGIMGATMTGVMSYADMVANFNGMRFWNTVLGKNVDILTKEEVSPYLSCVDGKWEQQREIDFSEYIDQTWDEGINCSWMRTESLLRKVKDRIQEYNDKTGENLSCPLNSELLERDGEKYKDLPIQIINYDGLQALK